jgi:hypothetical protein
VIPGNQSIEINGYSVSPGSCVIHFYYTQAEQQRLLGFLMDGVVCRDGVVMACTQDTCETLSGGLEMLGVCRAEHKIVQVEITSDLQTSIAKVAAAARNAVGHNHCRFGRVLCDFGSMIAQEAIFELEGSLNCALDKLELISVTQYNGRGFGAPITIEQFQTHALAIVGSAFFRENRHYTSPEAYFRKRAVGARK